MSVRPENITAVILAGGFGTRIKHLLGDLPKPMAPVYGKPFVEWIVRYLAAQQIRQVILSTGYMAESVERHFRSQPIENVQIHCVPETSPLGTAGGFLNAIQNDKSDAFLVLNGDSLVLAQLQALFQSQNDKDGGILGVHVPDASRFGTISQNTRGDLSGFNEKKPGAGIINAGVYLFPAKTLAKFPQKKPLSFETQVFPALAAQKLSIKVCVTDAPFLDIGTPESLPLADDFIRSNARFFES